MVLNGEYFIWLFLAFYFRLNGSDCHLNAAANEYIQKYADNGSLPDLLRDILFCPVDADGLDFTGCRLSGLVRNRHCDDFTPEQHLLSTAQQRPGKGGDRLHRRRTHRDCVLKDRQYE